MDIQLCVNKASVTRPGARWDQVATNCQCICSMSVNSLCAYDLNIVQYIQFLWLADFKNLVSSWFSDRPLCHSSACRSVIINSHFPQGFCVHVLSLLSTTDVMEGVMLASIWADNEWDQADIELSEEGCITSSVLSNGTLKTTFFSVFHFSC